MKFIGLLFLCVITGTQPAAAIYSQFVIMTPDAGRAQADFQPWLYSDKKQPEIVTVVVPFHKGMKKYWLITASHALKDDQLDFRPLITASYKPIPKYITSIIPLSPPLDDLGQPQTAGFIIIKIRKDDLARHYIHHDFAVGVDDGGYYRTYNLSSYPIGKQFDGVRDRGMELSRAKRQDEVQKLKRNHEASIEFNKALREKQKRAQDATKQPAPDLQVSPDGGQSAKP
ncbi:hypothetical protein NT6N_00700 [Oceaniferula spumae]|uniref:Peptidase S1 domain-containing protein n=1 Tax=Oceaniferula spumae TaxID=2979115 RepID=A0AAT9FGD3_9BACT